MRQTRLTSISDGPTIHDDGRESLTLSSESSRLNVHGKFLFRNGAKYDINGVTYGPFRPDASGSEYHDLNQVRQDFAQMRLHGINTVRTYTIPPIWLLDAALDHELLVMVGFPWEQHVTFLDDSERTTSIRTRLRDLVQECAGHPAIAAYTIGNEIPAPIVRWHGNRQNVANWRHYL